MKTNDLRLQLRLSDYNGVIVLSCNDFICKDKSKFKKQFHACVMIDEDKVYRIETQIIMRISDITEILQID